MDRKIASGLITTVLNGLQVLPVVMHEVRAQDGALVMDVVDGKQRLISLYAFQKGPASRFKDAPLALDLDEDHAMFDEWNQKTYEQLTNAERSNFQSFSLSVSVIPESTPLETVGIIYEDINTGSQKHSKQQVRRAVYWENYIELLINLAASEHGEVFRSLHAVAPSAKLQLQDQELILRFFAMYNSITGVPRLEAWKGRPSMNRFLSNELKL